MKTHFRIIKKEIISVIFINTNCLKIVLKENNT